jgi:hypothetical protein
MTEEESGSVFGGLGEAAGAAWDAAGNAADAVLQVNNAGVESVLEAGDAIVAGAAYAGGQYDTAAEWDAAATAHQQAAGNSWDQAGEDLSNAGTDIVGE